MPAATNNKFAKPAVCAPHRAATSNLPPSRKLQSFREGFCNLSEQDFPAPQRDRIMAFTLSISDFEAQLNDFRQPLRLHALNKLMERKPDAPAPEEVAN